MDEVKLASWKENFEQRVKNFQTEYDAFFLISPLDDIYYIKLDESDEWQLQIRNNVPSEIKSRLEQLLLDSKPEDSI